MKFNNTDIFDTSKEDDEDPNETPKLFNNNSKKHKEEWIMGKNGTVVTDSKAEGKLKLVKRPSQVDLPPTPGGGKWNLNSTIFRMVWDTIVRRGVGSKEFYLLKGDDQRLETREVSDKFKDPQDPHYPHKAYYFASFSYNFKFLETLWYVDNDFDTL